MTAPGFDSLEPPQQSLIDACVHCGFCLPSCPTYLLWGEEMDSPRGRIYLMKAALDGRAALTPAFVGHFDRCLGCMACVTACPSGVQYGPLIERTRAQIERRHPRSAADRAFRAVLFAVLPYPRRLRVALAGLAMSRWLLKATEALGLLRLLPRRLQAAVALAPTTPIASLNVQITPMTQPSGSARMHVGLLTGCVQRVAFAHVNQATVRVLAAEGCSVAAPPAQGCCGALPLHAGNVEQARDLARHTIDEFERAGVDRVVVNAAGCGSCMKEYGALLADDPQWAARAVRFSACVRDVSEVLTELGEPRAPRHPIRARVAYHDACHLLHAQGVHAQPRQILATIPELDVRTPAEAEICCGSAGIYNLVEPEAAAELGARKAAHIAALAPDAIATANPGCMLQIAAAGRRMGHEWRVVHPIEMLDASIRGVGLP